MVVNFEPPSSLLQLLYPCIATVLPYPRTSVMKHDVLLLAAPTWLWGRCGRHNSPPFCSVMDFIFCRPDSCHVCHVYVDTVAHSSVT